MTPNSCRTGPRTGRGSCSRRGAGRPSRSTSTTWRRRPLASSSPARIPVSATTNRSTRRTARGSPSSVPWDHLCTSPIGVGEVPSDCGLWIGELSSGAVTQITSNTDPPCDREYTPHWSPDGTQLTYWRDPVREWPADRDRRLRHQRRWHRRAAADRSGDVCRRLRIGRRTGSGSSSTPTRSTSSSAARCRTSTACTPMARAWSSSRTMRPRSCARRSRATRRMERGSSSRPPRQSTRSLWAIPAAGGEPIVLTPASVYTHGTWQPTPATT